MFDLVFMQIHKKLEMISQKKTKEAAPWKH